MGGPKESATGLREHFYPESRIPGFMNVDGTLEHVEDPDDFLREANRVFRSDV